MHLPEHIPICLRTRKIPFPIRTSINYRTQSILSNKLSAKLVLTNDPDNAVFLNDNTPLLRLVCRTIRIHNLGRCISGKSPINGQSAVIKEVRILDQFLESMRDLSSSLDYGVYSRVDNTVNSEYKITTRDILVRSVWTSKCD